MAKKHTRNQSANPSECFGPRCKDSTWKKTNHNTEVRNEKTQQEQFASYSRVNNLQSNPFLFVKTRVDDSLSSIPRQYPALPLANETGCQYHYYQTNNNRWMTEAEYKQQHINCWLDNVLKNNENRINNDEQFDTELISHSDQDEQSLNADDIPAKRYKPYHACAKRDLTIRDQNEMECRQEKIKTLNTLISKHVDNINGLKLCGHTDKHPNGGKNKLRGQERQQIPYRPKLHGTRTKERKTAFDYRNPNSIFFAVLEEEQLARRRSAGISWRSCCGCETFPGQDELHGEIGNISAS